MKDLWRIYWKSMKILKIKNRERKIFVIVKFKFKKGRLFFSFQPLLFSFPWRKGRSIFSSPKSFLQCMCASPLFTKASLGKGSHLSPNQSWRFIDSSWSFVKFSLNSRGFLVAFPQNDNFLHFHLVSPGIWFDFSLFSCFLRSIFDKNFRYFAFSSKASQYFRTNFIKNGQ